MKFWVSSAFLFYSPPTFSNPISKIEINQNFFLCKSYSKTSKKKSSIPELELGLKRRIYRAAKYFWGASIWENNTSFGFRVVKSETIKEMYMSPQRKKSSVFRGEEINVIKGEEKISTMTTLSLFSKTSIPATVAS